MSGLWTGFHGQGGMNMIIIGLVVFLILVVVSWSKGPKSTAPKKQREAETPEQKEEDVPEAPEKAMISELSDDEEDIPPPPQKAALKENADV